MENKFFCKPINDMFGKTISIQCSDRSIWKRRGIDESCVSTAHKWYDVSLTAMKTLIRDGFVEVSVEEFYSRMAKV